MGFDQYHEPPEELPQRVRTFARMIKSMIEEAEAIDHISKCIEQFHIFLCAINSPAFACQRS